MARKTTTVLHEGLNYAYTAFSIKKKSGKPRKITAPNKPLKSYQRHARHKLAWYFERQAAQHDVYKYFHGFVPGRNAVTGAKLHVGFDVTIQMDLSNFFDTVHKSMFDEYMFDELQLNSNFLFHKTFNYAAQGFPSSPMLGNIALVPSIVTIDQQLNRMFGENNYAVTMYADDLAVSYNSSEAYSEEWKDVRDTITEVLEDNDFQVNEKKTRVRFAKYGWRRILGINVGPTSIRATRKTMSKIHRTQLVVTAGDQAQRQRLQGLRTWSTCKLPGGQALYQQTL